VLLTQVANGKIFSQKSFKYFVWTPLGSRVKHKDAIFASIALTPVANLLLVFLTFNGNNIRLPHLKVEFSTGTNDTSITGGKFTAYASHRTFC
jgi:hypothetical protein